MWHCKMLEAHPHLLCISFHSLINSHFSKELLFFLWENGLSYKDLSAKCALGSYFVQPTFSFLFC